MASSSVSAIGRVLRRAVWWPLALLLVVFIGLVAWVYQAPGEYSIDVGGLSDEAYTLNFHGRTGEVTPTYRWSDVYGYVALPGLGGSRPFVVSMAIGPGRTAPVEVIVNGEQFYSGTLDAGWHDL